MRVLVTGGSGFIGKAFIEHLRKSTKYEILAPNSRDLSLFNEWQIIQVMKKFNPEVIVHLGAKAAPTIDKDEWQCLWKVNVDGTMLLLQYAPVGCRFVFASSIVVYGDTGHTIARNEGDFCKPTTIYGLSKLTSENLVNFYTRTRGIKGISLRMCATVGNGVTHGVLHDFVIKLRSKQQFFRIKGMYPGSIKPYMHISDVVRILEAAIYSNIVAQPVNIAAPDTLSIDAISDMAMSALRTDKKKVWGEPNFKGDNPNMNVDSSLHQYLYTKLQYPTSRLAVQQALMDIINNDN